MKITCNKIAGLALSVLLLGLMVTPAAFAATECDKDGDGFIVIPTSEMNAIASDVLYSENGNYSPIQWQDFYNLYIKGQDKLTESEKCPGLNFKKGAEPSRCDAVVLGTASNVYDPSKITTPVRGAQVNPAAFDAPGDGIDQNCDGQDAQLVESAVGGKDIGGLVQKVMTLLSRLVIVVSIAIMIWGGVLYATAAGDEVKTSKARKAILGAIIGLLVGLLAPTIVNLIAANLT